MMKRINLLIIAVALSGCISNISAQDWPQYLGPNRNSTSAQKGILRSWPASGPQVLWTVDVGKGFGGPVIKNGKVYLLDRTDEVEDILRCFDFSNGKELWKYSYPAPGTAMFPGS
jgi:outer membrane protein assembly factor BamB